MNIGVIGAGSVGQAVGFGWAKRGHQVLFGLRDPSDDRAAALRSKYDRVMVATNAQVAAASDVLALCTPWDATKAAIESCGDLSGKVLIDCTNPLKADFSDWRSASIRRAWRRLLVGPAAPRYSKR